MRTVLGFLVALVALPASAGEVTLTLQAPAPEAGAPAIPAPKGPSSHTAWEVPLPLLPPKSASKPRPAAEAPPPSGWVVLLPAKRGKRPKAPKVELGKNGPSPAVAYVAPGDEVVFSSKAPASLRFADGQSLAVEKRSPFPFPVAGAFPYAVGDAFGLIVAGEGARVAPLSSEVTLRRVDPGTWRVWVVLPSGALDAGEVLVSKDDTAALSFRLPE